MTQIWRFVSEAAKRAPMESKDILSSEFMPSAELIVNRLGDDTVALNLADGTYYGFDAVGTKIWEKLIGGEQPRSACAQIAAEFGVPIDQVEADARAYINELLANKLLYRK